MMSKKFIHSIYLAKLTDKMVPEIMPRDINTMYEALLTYERETSHYFRKFPNNNFHNELCCKACGITRKYKIVPQIKRLI